MDAPSEPPLPNHVGIGDRADRLRNRLVLALLYLPDVHQFVVEHDEIARTCASTAQTAVKILDAGNASFADVVALLEQVLMFREYPRLVQRRG